MTETQAIMIADSMLATRMHEIRQHITDHEIELRRELMYNVIKSKYRDKR